MKQQKIFDIQQLESRECLNLDETAAVLGISVGTLTVEVRSGRLEVLRLGSKGRRIVIPRAARLRWLERNTTNWRSADAA
jgi:predicted site-specific integrase-resolvase